MTDHRDWTGKVGSVWAQQWRRTDRSFRELTPRLVAAACEEPFDQALDIGCGAGELTCILAAADPSAHVSAVDISPELLGVARERCGTAANAAFALGDAASFRPLHPPDLLVSRHGVMFFADPTAAFAHLHAEAAAGARLVFSCFRTRGQNEWVSLTLGALAEPPAPPADPREPGPFAFGDGDYVSGLLSQAGWREIELVRIDYRMVFGAGDHPVADAVDYLGTIGPTAAPIAALGETERRATLERLGAMLEDHRRDDLVSLAAAAWIVTARKL